ncbi:molybdopterin synthase sulfur carrier subunit [mine drainage metagenome]|uniref:Molybdopterin synthase sulfur carrier subunit n=1 Tax=mine drainage metagenome TaxID=410659 RepID=A0A1J5R7F3_9ZZZZ
MVKTLYFAGLREALASAGEDIVLPPTVNDVAALRAHLAARGERWAALAKTKNLRAAINQRMVDESAAVADGDEVAFFPPVTGG